MYGILPSVVSYETQSSDCSKSQCLIDARSVKYTVGCTVAAGDVVRLCAFRTSLLESERM